MAQNKEHFVIIYCIPYQGSKLRPKQSHLRLNCFSFATKISGQVANLRLIFPLLFRNKKVTTHKNCGLIFCFAWPLTGKCSAKILRLLTLRLKVARLRLNFGILLQNCDWNFSLILSPAYTVKINYWPGNVFSEHNIIWCFLQ